MSRAVHLSLRKKLSASEYFLCSCYILEARSRAVVLLIDLEEQCFRKNWHNFWSCDPLKFEGRECRSTKSCVTPSRSSKVGLYVDQMNFSLLLRQCLPWISKTHALLPQIKFPRKSGYFSTYYRLGKGCKLNVCRKPRQFTWKSFSWAGRLEFHFISNPKRNIGITKTSYDRKARYVGMLCQIDWTTDLLHAISGWHVVNITNSLWFRLKLTWLILEHLTHGFKNPNFIEEWTTVLWIGNCLGFQL